MDYDNYGGGYNTSYGAQGGAGGGGFMPGEGSQTSPGGGGRVYGEDSLRPVTIKQITEAQDGPADGDFKIDGVKVTQITFVGQVRNISTQATHITYKLDDGTGTIEVKQWPDADRMEQDGKPKLIENVYARVWGKLKAFNNKRHVGAHMIRPVTDYNEVSYHLLESTAVHLFFTRGPPETGGAKAGANGGNTYGAQSGMQNGGGGGGNDGLNHLGVNARKVYTLLKTTPQSNEGLHMQDIAGRLGMDIGKVEETGAELVALGMIYSTVDENTWAILEI